MLGGFAVYNSTLNRLQLTLHAKLTIQRSAVVVIGCLSVCLSVDRSVETKNSESEGRVFLTKYQLS